MKPGLGPLSQGEIDDMADTLHVKPEEVAEMETRLAGREVSLEPTDEDDERNYAPISYLADPTGEPSQALEAEESARIRADGLSSALESLDPRSRRIIESRWLREKDGATLQDLADEFHVSAERIRQIESKAMQKMRGVLAEN
jgi:RNA polymerase sigma-32 factor